MLDDGRSATERLDAFVGSWRTEGWTAETAGARPARIEAMDIYEWLPGSCGLLHQVDARVGDVHVEGAEIIGWDPDSHAYQTLYFGTDGSAAYEATLSSDEAGVLIWAMRGRSDRFTGTFSDDGRRIEGYWEQPDDEGNWRRWMDVTLTRLDGSEQ
jgi:hypothetical protein